MGAWCDCCGITYIYAVGVGQELLLYGSDTMIQGLSLGVDKLKDFEYRNSHVLLSLFGLL